MLGQTHMIVKNKWGWQRASWFFFLTLLIHGQKPKLSEETVEFFHSDPGVEHLVSHNLERFKGFWKMKNFQKSWLPSWQYYLKLSTKHRLNWWWKELCLVPPFWLACFLHWILSRFFLERPCEVTSLFKLSPKQNWRYVPSDCHAEFFCSSIGENKCLWSESSFVQANHDTINNKQRIKASSSLSFSHVFTRFGTPLTCADF